MRTKKLRLAELHIKSFITQFNGVEIATLRGGDGTKSTGLLTEGANCTQLLPSESQCDGPPE